MKSQTTTKRRTSRCVVFCARAVVRCQQQQQHTLAPRGAGATAAPPRGLSRAAAGHVPHRAARGRARLRAQRLHVRCTLALAMDIVLVLVLVPPPPPRARGALTRAAHSYAELELLICGLPVIDLADWRAHTVYRDCRRGAPRRAPPPPRAALMPLSIPLSLLPPPGDHLVAWFWACVEGFCDEQRARLLQFVTGSSRLPPGGFSQITVRVAAAGNPPSRPRHRVVTRRRARGPAELRWYLPFHNPGGAARRPARPPSRGSRRAQVERCDAVYPTAHTCFNRLDLVRARGEGSNASSNARLVAVRSRGTRPRQSWWSAFLPSLTPSSRRST